MSYRLAVLLGVFAGGSLLEAPGHLPADPDGLVFITRLAIALIVLALWLARPRRSCHCGQRHACCCYCRRPA